MEDPLAMNQVEHITRGSLTVPDALKRLATGRKGVQDYLEVSEFLESRQKIVSKK